MKESVGYTATLNIVIIFIVVLFSFLAAAIIYFKSNKVSNVIVETIEKYEGYNKFAENEISAKLESIGYNKQKLRSCPSTIKNSKDDDARADVEPCKLVKSSNDGYCVYVCSDIEISNDNKSCEAYYYYKIKTNMLINVPIINNVLELPIYSTTNRMYNFESQSACNGVK